MRKMDLGTKVAQNRVMGFEPGQEKPAGSGRKRGTRNKKSQHLVEALEAVGLNIPEMLAEVYPWLSRDKQADILISLMSFVYAKRKAVEHSTQDGESPKVVIRLPPNGREVSSD